MVGSRSEHDEVEEVEVPVLLPIKYDEQLEDHIRKACYDMDLTELRHVSIRIMRKHIPPKDRWLTMGKWKSSFLRATVKIIAQVIKTWPKYSAL